VWQHCELRNGTSAVAPRRVRKAPLGTLSPHIATAIKTPIAIVANDRATDTDNTTKAIGVELLTLINSDLAICLPLGTTGPDPGRFAGRYWLHHKSRRRPASASVPSCVSSKLSSRVSTSCASVGINGYGLVLGPGVAAVGSRQLAEQPAAERCPPPSLALLVRRSPRRSVDTGRLSLGGRKQTTQPKQSETWRTSNLYKHDQIGSKVSLPTTQTQPRPKPNQPQQHLNKT
jgi:hypothetical protein